MNCPCSNCLLQPICNEPCDPHLKYVNRFLIEINYTRLDSYWNDRVTFSIAQSLRSGRVKIANNTLQYYSEIDTKTYRWSKQYGKWMGWKQ